MKTALTLLIGLLALTNPALAADDIVTATGAGIADGTRFPSAMQAKMLSRRAAMADAQRNLLEIINGVQVTSGTTVENMMVTSDKVGTRVRGAVQGAWVIDESTMEDQGSWVTEITLGMCMNRKAPECRQKPTLQQAIAASIAEAEEVTPFEAATPGAEPASGLIVDVSGVGFSPFLDVRIRNQGGQELYGPSLVSIGDGTDWLNFAPSVDQARGMTALVGKSPLLVSAERVEDGYIVVVSDDDASRIHGSNQAGDAYLAQGKVVFVMAR